MKGCDYTIHCNYPGGNIKIIDISRDKVKLEQDIRDTMDWWFYWNFCAEGMEGAEVIFEFQNGEVIGPWGPAYSKACINWNWLGEGNVIDKKTFRYKFLDSDNKVYFAFSLPYQFTDFERFYSVYMDSELLERQILTITEQGREVPLLLLGNKKAAKDIIFTCRHHACESTASYVLEGILQYCFDHSNSTLMNEFLIHIVPFVDLDGVENGDQGKARSPHDHNRDYIKKPIYSTTAAIIEYCKKLNLISGIDFHSPWKWGGRNDYPFFVKQEAPIKQELERLSAIFQQITKEDNDLCKIIYDPAYDIEKGEEWNISNTSTASAFYASLGASLAFTLEYPYFGVEGMIYTQENSRKFGYNFAKALEVYFRK